jgi:hypothetical protein
MGRISSYTTPSGFSNGPRKASTPASSASWRACAATSSERRLASSCKPTGVPEARGPFGIPGVTHSIAATSIERLQRSFASDSQRKTSVVSKPCQTSPRSRSSRISRWNRDSIDRASSEAVASSSVSSSFSS